MMNDKMYISKKESASIYGIAILMMIWHHLFGFPDRIMFEPTTQVTQYLLKIALYFAYFCKICVVIYAFLSGYGINVKLRQINGGKAKIKAIFFQMLRFMIKYWMILICWVGLGILVGKETFQVREFVKNFLTLSPTYNEEWWYVSDYLIMLLMSVPAAWCLSRMKNIKVMNTLILGAGLCVISFLNYYGTFPINIYLLAFIMGMAFSENNLMEKFDKHMKKGWKVVFVMASFPAVIFFKFMYSSNNQLDYLIAPVFIYGCVGVLNLPIVKGGLRSLLQRLGKYSLYIWLTHTFILYYYFKEEILRLQNPIVIYFVVLSITLFAGIGMDRLYNILFGKLVSKLKETAK